MLERASANKSKVTSTKSNSSTQISNRSATNLFINKNLTALQVYSNLFGNKNSATSHIGDANTHFKKTLRKYNEFTSLKHTKWLKERLKPKVNRTEVRNIKYSFEKLSYRKSVVIYSHLSVRPDLYID